MPQNPNLVNKQNPGPIAGMAAIFCAVFAGINLVLGLQSGGVSPEFVMFLVLSGVFTAVWWVARRI